MPYANGMTTRVQDRSVKLAKLDVPQEKKVHVVNHHPSHTKDVLRSPTHTLQGLNFKGTLVGLLCPCHF